MLQILSRTPAWVFILLGFLLALGLLQTRDRWVKRPIAYVLPVAMVALSLAGVLSSFGLKALPPIAGWLIGLLVVALAGRAAFLQSFAPFVSFDVQKNQFFIPGSWAPLVVIMAIFCTKYALAVAQARGMTVAPSAAAGLGLFFGACSGYFAARALALRTVAQQLGA